LFSKGNVQPLQISATICGMIFSFFVKSLDVRQKKEYNKEEKIPWRIFPEFMRKEYVPHGTI